MDLVFSVENLRVKLGDAVILDGVSLKLHAGELFLLLGRSGTGKSVLIKSATGFLPVESGTVSVAGEPMHPTHDAERIRKHVTLVHQDPALLDDESVLDNIALPLQWRFRMSRSDARARAREELERVGALKSVDVRADALSAGERKLVALARALAVRPRALLLDEPTTGLDVASAMRVGSVCRAIAHTGTAVLAVTHDIAPFSDGATRLALLHAGRLLVEMPAAEALSHPPPPLAQFLAGRAEGPLSTGGVEAEA